MQGIMTRPEGHTMEDEGAKKKWDAWKREEGLSKTAAKRQYILYLINTMRVYASGTTEARELLSELEYLWDQIKDLAYTDDEPCLIRLQGLNHPFTDRSVGAPLVHSYMDQSDRFSVGTPWPLQSTASVAASQQFKNNSEQIYLHSRRNTQLLLHESSHFPKSHQKNVSRSVALLGKGNNLDVTASALDDFRTWQGQINVIINKLSRDFANRQTSKDQHYESDSESEPETDLLKKYSKKIISILRLLGLNALHLAKNMSISVFAILFIVWCVNKNVIVRRTVVKKQLEGNRSRRELIINMVINTDENKWFVRILAFINSILGFV